MFDLKPTTREEAGYKLTKYELLLKEFEDSGLEGVKMEMKSAKKAYNTAAAINTHLKRYDQPHIECFARQNIVFLFNTIKEKSNV